jgi:lysophospholipid acyltransferase (LPLAT)-like uncharacterized protein
MVRAQIPLIDVSVESFGRLVGLYSRMIITPASTAIIIEAPLPPAAAVLIGWHEGNLLGLAMHARIRNRQAMAFVPPGLAGVAMRGWLEACRINPVPLASDARRGLALRQMEAALAAGQDVLIAVDGPCGPSHRVAPGALWLARKAGVQVIPVGFATQPNIRLPRWDRLIVPLPMARAAIAMGHPLPDWSGRQHTEATKASVAATLSRLTALADQSIVDETPLKFTEAKPWL